MNMSLNNEQLLDYITNYYERFEQKIIPQIINTKQFDTPVNFKQAKEFARHRWYVYKEGFSPKFVSDFIKRFSTSKNNIIFDPFGGIGTTILEASLLGYEAYSNDINPLGNYIAKIKTAVYATEDVNYFIQLIDKFKKDTFVLGDTPPDNQTIQKYFTTDIMNSILKIQFWINNIGNKKIQPLFNLALLTILEKISTHRKDGNGVKKKKKYKDYTFDEIREIILDTLNIFLVDINETRIRKEPEINEQSSFDNYESKKKIDLVITSPPYANCFDYSKVYLIELWMGRFFKTKDDQKRFRELSIISHVHYKWEKRNSLHGHDLINSYIAPFLSKKELWDKKIPSMLIGYFSDMGKTLDQLTKHLNSNATIGIVVGNSVYGGLPIATDIILAEIAQKLGYKIEGIEVYRTLTPSSQQLKIIRDIDKKYLRESMIILKWK